MNERLRSKGRELRLQVGDEPSLLSTLALKSLDGRRNFLREDGQKSGRFARTIPKLAKPGQCAATADELDPQTTFAPLRAVDGNHPDGPGPVHVRPPAGGEIEVLDFYQPQNAVAGGLLSEGQRFRILARHIADLDGPVFPHDTVRLGFGGRQLGGGHLPGQIDGGRFGAHIDTDERVDACDNNPFGVTVTLRAELVGALTKMEEALDEAYV